MRKFGPFKLDTRGRVLFRSGERVEVVPKALDVLLALIEAEGNVVSKEDLLKKVWPDTFIEDSALTHNVSQLRKALGEGTWIETIPKRGYRFAGQLTEAREEPSAPPPPAPRRNWRWLAGGFAVAAIALSAWLRPATTGRRIESIAVLPFVNLAGDPSQEYAAAGMTDALITSLGQIRALKVLSRTATQRYKAWDKGPPPVAAELGADAWVEGLVQKSGDRVRVTAQLVDSSTHAMLWAKDYDFDFADLLKVEGEIAREVAAEVRAEVTPDEKKRLSRDRRIAPAAEELYLAGLDAAEHRDEKNIARAIALFTQAIERQPDFAEAYAQLAQAWMERSVWGAIGFRAGEAPARAAAIKALELDPSLADAHAAMAEVGFFYDQAWVSAEREERRALELDPNNSYAHRILAGILQVQGRHDEAVATSQRLLSLDPASSFLTSEHARILYRARRYPEAIALYRRAQQLDPSSPGAHTRLAELFLMTGQFEEALRENEEAAALRNEDPSKSARFAGVYAHMGRAEEARSILNRIDRPGANLSGSIDAAVAYFHLGNRERGFYWLTQRFDRREFTVHTAVEPRFDIVRDDPRFRALVARLQFPKR